MTLAYLLCVVGALAAMAGLLRRRPAAPPPPVAPAVEREPEPAVVVDLVAILRATADRLDAYRPTA